MERKRIEISLEGYLKRLPSNHRAVQEYKRLVCRNRFLENESRKKKRKFWQKRYPSLSFYENFLGGHISLGRFTFYGENAMNWGVTIWTETFGYICFRLPFRCFGVWCPLYFYTSPNATPRASTFYRGPYKNQKEKAAKRRKKFGFRYDTDLLTEEDR